MLQSKFGEIIRTEKDLFKTPNISEYLGEGFVEVYLENFRRNQQKKEYILFFEFEKKIYFPIWFEFRSINNNLLFLFKEYNVHSFTELKHILLSSLEKEEHYQAEIKAIVYKTKKLPSLSVHLESFEVLEDDRIFVEEE